MLRAHRWSLHVLSSLGWIAIAGASPAAAAVSWPQDQLLPSFSAPAATQDLILLSYPSPRWEGEGAAVRHETGRNDGDGWLCQVGIDAPNLFMTYGPYDTTIPIRPNTASYRLKIDNNTADNGEAGAQTFQVTS